MKNASKEGKMASRFTRREFLKGAAMTAVGLAAASCAQPTPQIIEKVVAINRLGQVANRAYSVAFEYVEAIVDKPRQFFIPGDTMTTSTQGCPIFSLDGKVIGVFVLRAIRDTSGGQAMMGAGQNVMAIIQPAADILEGASQVEPYEGENGS